MLQILALHALISELWGMENKLKHISTICDAFFNGFCIFGCFSENHLGFWGEICTGDSCLNNTI